MEEKKRRWYPGAVENLRVDGGLLLYVLTAGRVTQLDDDWIEMVARAVGHWGLTLLDNPEEAEDADARVREQAPGGD